MSAWKGPRPEQGNAAPTNHALDSTQEAPAGQCRLLSLARRYVSAGLSVIPIRSDGSKQPAFAWKTYTERMPTDGELVRWFGPYCGIGIVCGAVSGNLEVIDFDAPGLFEPWRQLVDSWAPGLVNRLLIVQTPRGGRHVLYRCEQIEGNQPLARRPAPKGSEPGAKAIILIETRGEGGQILAPGCAPECHPTGGRYVFVAGPGYGSITSITPDERAILLNAARSFNEYVPPQAVVIGKSPDAASNGALRPGDDFNARAQWHQILEPAGWAPAHRQGDVIHWRRPGKNGPGSSATTGYCRDGDLFYVFSSNAAPFEPDRGYTKFAACALLNHDGDFSATAKALSAAGYGSPSSEATVVTPASTSSDWPDPQPLPDGLPPVMPFNFDLLPSSVRPWIHDIAERIQCPPDFSAVAIMIAIASVVGRQVAIRPKRQDDWTVVPNLWGCAVGPPSVMKTPAIQEPLRPLHRLEVEAKAEHEEGLSAFEAEQMVTEQRKVAAKSAVKEALRGGGDALAIARAAIGQESDPPPRKRYLVNDSSVEKLGEILNQNPNGVLVYRDELIGFLRSLEKDGQEGARSFYLEAWNGTGRFTYDRIGRGTIDIEAAIVSVIGSIQPGPLRSYILSAVHHGEGADGLMQRFQLAVYPDISEEWENVDRWPNSPARKRAFELIRTLSKLEPDALGAERDSFDQEGIPFLRFATDAQERFDIWRSNLERRLRAGRDHSVLIEHLAKYRSLVPSLALLIHIADGQVGPVGLQALDRAIRWSAYLESHAHRIYSVAITPDTAEAGFLAKKILAGELGDEFALRDVYRHGWIGLSTRDAAQRAANVLVDLDWLREEVNPTPGRNRQRFKVNPKVRTIAIQGTDKGDKSPDSTLLSVLSVPPSRKSTRAATGTTPEKGPSGINSAPSENPDDGWEEVA